MLWCVGTHGSASSTTSAGDSYDALGYVPEEAFQQAPSLTLDYAFDDWATSQLAGFVGNTSAQQTLLARSKNYRYVPLWQWLCAAARRAALPL